MQGLSLELGIGARGQKARMMVLPEGRKSFKIGLAVLIQYRRVTATQPRCRGKDRAGKKFCLPLRTLLYLLALVLL